MNVQAAILLLLKQHLLRYDRKNIEPDECDGKQQSKGIFHIMSGQKRNAKYLKRECKKEAEIKTLQQE